MDLVQEVQKLREERLHKIQQNNKKEEYHGWFTNDPWITHKIYKNVITNTYHEVSYVTKEKYNPLPFHVDITYVGMIHV
jgi:hypothetical protein